VPVGCLAVVLGCDWVLLRRRPRWILSGIFDHPAHLATAGLMLLNLPPRPRGWVAGFLAGSLVADVDHLPLALREEHPSLDDPRPVSHCLLAVAPVTASAAALRSRPLGGAAAGMLAHFARDLGVGTGVPLAWPISRRALRVPYAVYGGACAVLAARAALRAGAPNALDAPAGTEDAEFPRIG
jgi:LexA-binding, inner membrane-associated putative hydrolase